MTQALLEIDLLQCFLAVAHSGGFTKAGEQIGLSQSGVSIKIKRLEDRLNLKLFARTSKSLALTPEGELLKGYAHRILNLHNEAVQRLCVPDIQGTLLIGIEDYFVPNLLPSILARFNEHYPSVHLEVKMGNGMELVSQFEAGKLDMVLAGDCCEVPQGRTLVTAPLVWMFGANYELPEQSVLPLVTFPPPCGFRREATEALDAAGLRWNILFTGNSVVSLQAAVEAGLGITALPAWAMTNSLRVAPAQYKLPPLSSHSVSVYMHEEDSTPARELFVDYLELALSKLHTSVP
ncbi:MAG: LysR substrate-binding domain-containing protein [Desulfovibrionales bacterium]|nr:LysR substrate-binding domain-containing protein [Desulfovibrionales bacterium]